MQDLSKLADLVHTTYNITWKRVVTSATEDGLPVFVVGLDHTGTRQLWRWDGGDELEVCK